MTTELIISVLAAAALVQSITFLFSLALLRRQAMQLFDARIGEMLATTRLLHEAEARRADRDEFVTYLRTMDQMITRLQGVTEAGSRLSAELAEATVGAAGAPVEDLAGK